MKNILKNTNTVIIVLGSTLTLFVNCSQNLTILQMEDSKSNDTKINLFKNKKNKKKNKNTLLSNFENKNFKLFNNDYNNSDKGICLSEIENTKKSTLELLRYAIYEGKVDAVKGILKFNNSKININARNEDNMTLLSDAIITGQNGLINSLLSYGATVRHGENYSDIDLITTSKKLNKEQKDSILLRIYCHNIYSIHKLSCFHELIKDFSLKILNDLVRVRCKKINSKSKLGLDDYKQEIDDYISCQYKEIMQDSRKVRIRQNSIKDTLKNENDTLFKLYLNLKLVEAEILDFCLYAELFQINKIDKVKILQIIDSYKINLKIIYQNTIYTAQQKLKNKEFEKIPQGKKITFQALNIIMLFWSSYLDFYELYFSLKCEFANIKPLEYHIIFMEYSKKISEYIKYKNIKMKNDIYLSIAKKILAHFIFFYKNQQSLPLLSEIRFVEFLKSFIKNPNKYNNRDSMCCKLMNLQYWILKLNTDCEEIINLELVKINPINKLFDAIDFVNKHLYLLKKIDKNFEKQCLINIKQLFMDILNIINESTSEYNNKYWLSFYNAMNRYLQKYDKKQNHNMFIETLFCKMSYVYIYSDDLKNYWKLKKILLG